MNQNRVVIDAFGIELELATRLSARELELLKEVSGEPDVEVAVGRLSSIVPAPSSDVLAVLMSCAAGLAQRAEGARTALTALRLALAVAQRLGDYRSQAIALLGLAQIQGSRRLYKEAYEAVKRGKIVCAGRLELKQLAGDFERTERAFLQQQAALSVPTEQACVFCLRSFRVHDGAPHVVLSRKHETMAKSAHCFSCSIVICFGCSRWVLAKPGSDEVDISRDLKIPVCPLCGTPIGAPDAGADRPPLWGWGAEGTGHVVDALWEAPELRSVPRSLGRSLLARDMATAIVACREQMGSLPASTEQSLGKAVERYRSTSQTGPAAAAEILRRLVVAVRQAQAPPEAHTRDLYEHRLDDGNVTAEQVERSLVTASMLLNQDDFTRAMREVERARQGAERLGDHARLARAHLVTGLIQQKADRRHAAILAFKEAIAVAVPNGNAVVAAKAHGNLAGCYARTAPRGDEAMHHAQEALRLYREVGDEAGVARTLNSVGGIHLARGQPEQALPYLEESLRMKKRLGDQPGVANTLGNLAAVHQAMGKMAETRQLNAEAVGISRAHHSPVDLSRHLYNEAAALFERGDVNEAIHRYEEALSALENVRARTSDKRFRESLLEPFRPGFDQLAALYLRRGDAGGVLRTVERLAAIGLCEYLEHPAFASASEAAAESGLVAEFQLPPLDVAELWTAISEPVRTTAIRLTIVDGHLTAILALPSRAPGDWYVHRYDDIGEDELAQWLIGPAPGGWLWSLHNFRRALQGVARPAHAQAMPPASARDALSAAWRPLFEALGEGVISPLIRVLRASGARRILFAPSAYLRHFPLHALSWRENGRQTDLIEQFEVHYTPSFRVFLLTARYPTVAVPSALILADPDGSLPGAREEARLLSGLWPNSVLQEGPRATWAALASGHADSSLLHCATHAVFDASDPRRSGICLALDADEVPAEGLTYVGADMKTTGALQKAQFRLVTVAEVFSRRTVLPGALIVLSACDTGAEAISAPGVTILRTGSDPPEGPVPSPSNEDVIGIVHVRGDGAFKMLRLHGDEPVSLSAAFLAAGAGSVMCSNWPVDDIATALFMLRFYTHLASCDAVSALSIAQQELRSLTAGEACARWNEHAADARGVAPLDTRKLGELLSMELSESDRPFQSPYFWAAFSLYGRAHPPIAR